MRVFLDVGANNGQTLAAVREPEFAFDKIHCFEPASTCWPKLAKLVDRRVAIHEFGLWDRECKQELFAPGHKGAGLWMKNKSTRSDTELCQFRKASTWFHEHVRHGDTVFLKLNCEGAECDILDDLLDSGEFDKVRYAMVDFDVRKIASQRHREAETRARLEPFGFPRIAYCREVMKGPTHAERIKNWLRLAEGK